jgi:hypothetical protein
LASSGGNWQWTTLHRQQPIGLTALADQRRGPLITGVLGPEVGGRQHRQHPLGQLDPSRRLWHGRYPLGPTLGAVSFEADQAALVLTDPRRGRGASHGRPRRPGPWDKIVMDGVPVVAARRLPSMLRALPAVLGPERVATLADQARIGFHPAA